MQKNFFDFKAELANGTTKEMAEFGGKVVLVVNVASRCSFTPQYHALEALHRRFQAEGLVVLGFPCNQFLWQEPDASSEVQKFCSTRYDVTFPIFAKTNVNGSKSHPIFEFLKSKAPGWLGIRRIGWNFTKFLVHRNGVDVDRFSTLVKPETMETSIRSLIG